MALTVTGIDVSVYNAGDVSIPTSYDFVFVKAAEGLTADPRWAQHSTFARRNGLVLGAYDFGRRSIPSGADQARYFLRVVGTATRLVAIDLEGADEPTVAQARDWVATCKAAGMTTGVYHSLSGFPLSLGQDFNWVASWGSHPPSIPWAFWQWAGAPLDRDYYAGSVDGLLRLAQLPVPPQTDTAGHTLHIAAGATLRYCAIGGGPNSPRLLTPLHPVPFPKGSSAPCGSPRQVLGMNGGVYTVAIPTAGTYAGKAVQVANGVTVS
jgi:hypothetical protein